MYIDKIEIFPAERRADIIYIKGKDDEWAKGQYKYELLLLKILTIDIQEWTFGKGYNSERSVIVEW